MMQNPDMMSNILGALGGGGGGGGGGGMNEDEPGPSNGQGQGGLPDLMSMLGGLGGGNNDSSSSAPTTDTCTHETFSRLLDADQLRMLQESEEVGRGKEGKAHTSIGFAQYHE